MQIGFLWHMHQPIYYPGESITQTEAAGHYSFSVIDVHNQRFGPYTTWPRDAIQSGLGLPNLGASVSFSGSLIENLNTLKNAGVNGGMWNNWQSAYTQARNWTTAEGNPRLDLIGFNYNHALLPLLDVRDMRMQIQMHKAIVQQTFGSNVPYSKGFFPAETAFSERIIPALVAEGIDWTLVDNIHFDRATKNYPHTNASGLFAPNKADQINPDPAASGGAWVQLNNVWAPSKVSAPFSYRPHNVQYVDPNSGAIRKLVAVPAARYEGNEDGRGGFGALQYQTVMDQVRPYNNDPAHPMLVMLHHDGDNYGGGSDSYYHSNFQSMVNWANGNANYNVTTVSDYLKKYPVAGNDVIHVENGSWAGADNGDAEFKKWLGDPNGSGWSPDRNSWAVLTAAKNRVFTADDIAPVGSVMNVVNGTGSATEKAWHFLTQAESSDHWYWDGTQVWDSNVTRGSNLAVAQANQVISAFQGTEHTPPSVFVPQRDSYNPGAYEFGATPEPSNFKVWTYAYDVSGLTNVTLKWRADVDGENLLGSTQNETYVGGSEVGAWTSVAMTSSDVAPPGNILAAQYRALQYAGMINGQSNKLIDYYVEATDANGNISRTDIQHVWVGASTGGGGGGTPGQFTMDGQLDADARQIATNNGVKLYYSMHAGKLYVATNDAGEGNDHFIYLAKVPGAMRSANWAKAGQIANWDAYLADENDNNYSGWFDATGAVQNATGTNDGVLEGTIDLAGEFGGTIPLDLYLAVGLFPSPDGAALLSAYQVPASLDSDGNIQTAEYLHLSLPQGWALGGSGDWNTAWNWADTIPNATGAHAKFLNVIAAPSTVTSGAAVSVGQITFDSPYGYTLAGTGQLSIDVTAGSATVTVLQGSHQIAMPTVLNDSTVVSTASGAALLLSGPLTIANGSTLTTTGSGTVAITSAVTALPGAKVKVSGGNLIAATDLNGATVQLDAGNTWFDTGQHLLSLSIASGANATITNGPSRLVVKTGSLSVAGKLDIGGNGAIVDHDGASPLAAIATAISGAYNGGAWNGNGISSTNAALDSSLAVGYAEASAVGSPAMFLNEPADATSVLVRVTFRGDANLDGAVDSVDFNLLAGGFGDTGQYWFQGDFNYDGVVDTTDFNQLVTNFAQILPAPTESATLGAPIPEPSTLAAVIGSLLLAGRPKDRSRGIRRRG